MSAQAVDLRHRQPSLVLQVVFEKLSIKLAENQGVPFPEVSAESSLFVGGSIVPISLMRIDFV